MYANDKYMKVSPFCDFLNDFSKYLGSSQFD